MMMKPQSVGDVMSAATENEPPFSRLFVNSPPSLYTEEQLQQQFSQFGVVEFVRLLPGSTKCFVKFDRASAAAHACEALNGFSVVPGQPPFKISYATPRGSTPQSINDNESPPHSRLFVTHGKQVAEQDIQKLFSQFGDVESIRSLADPQTGESRGITYVKYSKSSSAMRAMEDVNAQSQFQQTSQPFRVRVAECTAANSRSSRHGGGGAATTSSKGFQFTGMSQQYSGSHQPQQSLFNAYGATSSHRSPWANNATIGNDQEKNIWKDPSLGDRRVDNNSPPGSRVWFALSKKLQVTYLKQLFAAYGDLESIFVIKNKQTCGFAKYYTPLAANESIAALNGMLVAEDTTIKVALANPLADDNGENSGKRPRLF